LTVYGSRAYGTSLPDSDYDFRGIAIPPRNYYLGLTNEFKTAEQKDPDLVVFELRKFLRLTSDCNPNALEILFTEPEDQLVVSALGAKLLANRDLFLTKRAKHTFFGYAHSQMGRILTHRAYILNPMSAPPTRKEFDLPDRPEIPKEQLSAVFSLIQKRIDDLSWHELDDLESSARQAIQTEFQSKLLEVTGWNYRELGDRNWFSAANSLGFETNFLEYLDKERRYKAKCREFDQYQEWKRNRNPARAALEEKNLFDCYSEDTEFLTSEGWRSFEEITGESLLATVLLREGMVCRKFLSLEYQKPIDKFDSKYSGPMYHIFGVHTDSLVTANHRLLFQKSERRSKKKGGWVLEEASSLPDTFEVLIAPTPRTTTFSNKKLFEGLPIPVREYLSLMGWYLSDGCALFDTKGDAVSIRISQKPDGKLSGNLRRWGKKYKKLANCSIYTYTRKPSSYNTVEHQEMLLDVRNRSISARMVAECGCTESKRVPRYAFSLSKSLIDCLLIALILGDGTKREHKTKTDSYIYYSRSRDLAGDVQELALVAGWETALWGPFLIEDLEGRECLMYQVHLRRDPGQTRTLMRFQNVRKVEVVDQRVVCFTVPNGTLITRRNGKVSIHGNCKHGMHLVRLARSCKELLSTGKLQVRRPDAEELLSIRQGAWSFDQLYEWFQKEEEEIAEVVKTSTLPHHPNAKRIDALCLELIEESFRL